MTPFCNLFTERPS